MWAEQGLGDTLQFVRYARLLARAGADVLVEVQPELERLIRDSVPEIEVVARGRALPRYDVQVPLMSVPYLVGTRLDTIPADGPYLRADADRMAVWAERLGPRAGRRRVGLVWAGNPSHKNNRRRSMSAGCVRL